MSTIASPRPSLALSSRRTSASTDTATIHIAHPTTDRGSLRRNRAALRDYYNLKPPSPSTAIPSITPIHPSDPLDDPNFDSATYTSTLLSTSNLETILRATATLASDIRGLDGEKKALVYDNYSKLIAATETIRRMREKMDPLTPVTGTLMPALAGIAETAVGLVKDSETSRGNMAGVREEEEKRETVRWVLDAPHRLENLVKEGRREEAEADWVEVQNLLDKWKGVRGVEEVRRRCLQAIDHTAKAQKDSEEG